jgi:putative ABC transport system permease protein
MLWSINIRVMGKRSNITLTNQDSILKEVVKALQGIGVPPEFGMLVFFFLLAMLFKLLLDIFFRTDLGLTLGAMGNNPQMVISTGVDPSLLKFIGLALSNGLVAIAGAFACQYQGFADVNLGQQIIISGLASVMIGEFLIKSNRIWALTIRVLLGSILFRALMYLARQYGYDIGLLPTDQRLLTGALIIAALAISQVRKQTAKAKAVTGLAGANGAAKSAKEAGNA